MTQHKSFNPIFPTTFIFLPVALIATISQYLTHAVAQEPRATVERPDIGMYTWQVAHTTNDKAALAVEVHFQPHRQFLDAGVAARREKMLKGIEAFLQTDMCTIVTPDFLVLHDFQEAVKFKTILSPRYVGDSHINATPEQWNLRFRFELARLADTGDSPFLPLTLLRPVTSNLCNFLRQARLNGKEIGRAHV